MRIRPVCLGAAGTPALMNKRIITFSLREPVRNSLSELSAQGVLTSVGSYIWVTLIAMPLKHDGRTPRYFTQVFASENLYDRGTRRHLPSIRLSEFFLES
ncbi:uncharacterized protein DEA37_0003792 [Paragonimus westermani]|uniref:Uncharacterized protein n=1 Tax=Paragonimus westermani TaxID=34504 RepID=A0A5J4NEA5_9TREM|nr:uncharacterized protein DEA37_0003792 [Paragonimus westermani]